MAKYKTNPEKFHVTLAMLKIKEPDGLKDAKKMIVDIKDNLKTKGPILKIGNINTFPSRKGLYAKVVPEPSDIMHLISSFIEESVSGSNSVELINKPQKHHMTLFKHAKKIRPNFYKEHLYIIP